MTMVAPCEQEFGNFNFVFLMPYMKTRVTSRFVRTVAFLKYLNFFYPTYSHGMVQMNICDTFYVCILQDKS